MPQIFFNLLRQLLLVMVFIMSILIFLCFKSYCFQKSYPCQLQCNEDIPFCCQQTKLSLQELAYRIKDLGRYFCGILSDDLFIQFFVIQFHYINISLLLFCLAILHVQYKCNILQLAYFNYQELIKGIIKKSPNFKIAKFFRNSL